MGSLGSNFRSCFPLVFIAVCLTLFGVVQGNDEIFPAQPSAEKFVNFDSRSFTIRGLKTFLTSGSIHYTRVPRELWRDRLDRAKMAGFDTITTCVPWNAHEPEEAEFDFSGNKDLSGFLDACREARLYVIVRIGPYSGADWDLGGFPAWLAVGRAVRLRTDDPEYLKYVAKWFEKLLPVVARHQVHKGGPVIMVQLEHEYKGGSGTEEDAYLAHLRKKAIELGIEVPMFFSGLHQGADPAGYEPTKRTGNSPWFSTELRSGSCDLFGELHDKESDRCFRATWKIMAFGGAGYNYHMLHGGTNWGYTSSKGGATSYDFAAPIGESGALRKSYFRLRKNAIFSATFGHILSRGTADEEGFKINSSDLSHYVCRTPRGSVVFLENPHDDPITTRVQIEGHPDIPMVEPLTLLPGEILPVIVDMPLGGGVTISHCAANLLTMRRLRDRTFIFVYGREGEPGEIVFDLKGALRFVSGVQNYIIDATGRTLIVSFEFPGEWDKKDMDFISGIADIQVVVLNEKLAERAWFDPWTIGPAIVVGPYYVRQFAQQEESARIIAEFRGDEKACYIYTRQPMRPDEKSTKLITFTSDKPNLCLNGKLESFPDLPPIPQPSGWRFATAAQEAVPQFDDSAWPLTDDPGDMGAMPGAHRSFYGWYRCSFPGRSPWAGESSVEGEAKAEFPFAGDTIYVFLNGKLAGKAEGRGPQTVSFPLQKGSNLLAVLARHSGREQLDNFSGVAGLQVAAGIHGPVKLVTNAGSEVLKGWRYRAGLIGEEKAWFTPEGQSDVPWKSLGGAKRPAIPTFFCAAFAYKPGPAFSEILRLKTKGLSRGTLWLNGKIIGQYVTDGEYYLPEPWLKEENLIVLADEEGKSPDQVTLIRETPASAHVARIELVPE